MDPEDFQNLESLINLQMPWRHLIAARASAGKILTTILAMNHIFSVQKFWVIFKISTKVTNYSGHRSSYSGHRYHVIYLASKCVFRACEIFILSIVRLLEFEIINSSHKLFNRLHIYMVNADIFHGKSRLQCWIFEEYMTDAHLLDYNLSKLPLIPKIALHHFLNPQMFFNIQRWNGD